MQNNMRLDLQLFAEASAAPASDGGEAAAGVKAAAAGQQSETGEGQSPVPEQKKTSEGHKPSWEELLQDPEYKAAFDSRVQGIIRQRLGKNAQLLQHFETLRPALAALAGRYGLDPDEPDYERLSAAIQADDRTPDPRTDPQPLLRHFEKLRQEAEQFKALQPDFDLERELRENESFVRMTAPQVGLSVADAYFAAHREQVLREREHEREQEALAAVTSTILAGQNRPRENSGGSAGASAPLSYRQLNAQQRRAFKARLQQSWAKGEKPSVGF